MASPNGRRLLEPPKKRFQIVSANCSAWESDARAMLVAPAMLRVTIFPFAWHSLISDARKVQSGKLVPGNAVPTLQV